MSESFFQYIKTCGLPLNTDKSKTEVSINKKDSLFCVCLCFTKFLSDFCNTSYLVLTKNSFDFTCTRKANNLHESKVELAFMQLLLLQLFHAIIPITVNYNFIPHSTIYTNFSVHNISQWCSQWWFPAISKDLNYAYYKHF
jgi:hypothetical protein